MALGQGIEERRRAPIVTQHITRVLNDVPQREVNSVVAGMLDQGAIDLKVVRQANGGWQITATLPGDPDVPTE